MFEKNIDSRISIAIQECIACAHRGPNFTTGKVQRNDPLFNKDVFIQRRMATNHMYYTHLQKSGEPEGLIWAESDLKPHFHFSEYLDCKYVHRDKNLQARLSEQVFVQNNTMLKGLGFTPHQMPLGLSSGVPGIYDVPENNSNFARSLNRIKVGIYKNQVASTQPHPTLGGRFPYKPVDAVHFLGSKGTSASEWKYIIASAFKFKLLCQPALPIMGEAQASWVETSGAWWIFFS